MTEQLRLEGITEVPCVVGRIAPAVRLLGLTEVQKCRAILAAAEK